jgi:hypothetical protein
VRCSEDSPEEGPTITYWPAPSKRKRPSWTNELIEDWDLYKLVLETYTALDNDAPVLAAMGLRTVFDRTSEKLGVDAAFGFAEKLDLLLKMGKIGQSEKGTLEVLTDAGGAAAHRRTKLRSSNPKFRRATNGRVSGSDLRKALLGDCDAPWKFRRFSAAVATSRPSTIRGGYC